MPEYFQNPEHAAEELRNIDLSIVAKEIERYNRQFGMGRMLSKIILRGINSEEGKGLNAQNQKEDRQAFLERVNNTYGIYLEKSGVALEAVGGASSIFTNNEQVESSLLRINLANRSRFLEYISALDAKTIKPSQVEGLKIVLSSLMKQLNSEYDVQKLDPRAVELLAGLEQIIIGCQKLDPKNENGLNQIIKQLTVYMEAAKGAYIKEYILVGRTSALAEVGAANFGPSKWHTDSSEESYKQRWDRVLELYARVKKNPQAANLALEVAENLRRSAEFARKDIDNLAKGDSKYWDDARKESYFKILDDVRSKLKPLRN